MLLTKEKKVISIFSVFLDFIKILKGMAINNDIRGIKISVTDEDKDV
jgi:hypothetical protein